MTTTASAVRTTEPLPRRYWRLWTATISSGLGDGATAAALPLLAVSLTRDPRLVAAVSTAAYLPWLLFSLVAGALADRIDRRRLMWVAQAVQATVVAVIALAAGTHLARIWLLCAAALLLGTAETVFDNAAQSVLPQVVSPGQLQNANAAQYAGQTVTERFVGPPIGGLLFAASAGLPFALDAVSFLVSAALIVRLPLRQQPSAAPLRQQPSAAPLRQQRQATPVTASRGLASLGLASLIADITEGLRWLANHRLLRGLAAIVGVNNLCNQLAWSTMVLLATGTFGLSARGYGILLAAQALGGVAGSLVNRRLVRAIGARSALVAALITTALAYLGAGLAPDIVLVGALFALSGVASMVWNVVTVSLRQDIVPGNLLGRVNSAYRMISWGTISLGGVLGGFLAHWLSLRAPLVAASGLRLATLLAAVPLLVAAGRDLGAGRAAAAESDG
ncbi:MFS transporter [Rugosimonospora africana]|uniref:MFS transporter n=1 Tax=Rugosimonospora africana TaxID=556532 RepID=UPI0019404F4B|nr:MFS transporter [Rugosimonospora africana]